MNFVVVAPLFLLHTFCGYFWNGIQEENKGGEDSKDDKAGELQNKEDDANTEEERKE